MILVTARRLPLAIPQGIQAAPSSHSQALRNPLRLLRRRMHWVRQRASLILSFKGLFARTRGTTMPLAKLKSLSPEAGAQWFEPPGDQLAADTQLRLIGHYDEHLHPIEKTLLKQGKSQAGYQRLESLPGIGKIPGMTIAIALETGDIGRFAGTGHFASYCHAG